MKNKSMHSDLDHANTNPDESKAFPGNIAFAPALLDPDLDVPAGIIGPDGNCPPKRFSVYRNNVVVSLLEALSQAYPSTKVLLGEENFATVSRIYISNSPPTTAMMQSYGDKFPDFLKQFQPLEKSPFLADLANVEKYWLESYHATDLAPLPAKTLGTIDPEILLQVKFSAHPACFLIKSQYDLSNMFQARDHKDPEQVNYDMCQNPGALLITRPGYEVLLSKLDQSQRAFFTSILDNKSLGESVEDAFAIDEKFDASSAIALMLATGSISQISNP